MSSEPAILCDYVSFKLLQISCVNLYVYIMVLLLVLPVFCGYIIVDRVPEQLWSITN